MMRGFNEYGGKPNNYLRADRQVTLLHEIGHHVEHSAGVLSLSQFAAGEARAENYAYRHAGGNKGQEGSSDYDSQVTGREREARALRQRWGAGQVTAYKAQRGAGTLPGEPLAPAAAARHFTAHDFTDARSPRQPQLDREAG